MAEESINVPITPNLVIPDGVRSRSSEGKLIATKGRATKQTDPRRASTGSFRNGGKNSSSGKPSPLNNGESLVPHYLRASTGSCHDFCKYGKKHETEVKPWQAKARKVIKPMLNQQIKPMLNHQTNSESGDLSENKITKVVKPKPHPVSKTNFPNLTAVPGKRISSPSNESTIHSRPVSAKGKIMIANEKKKNVLEKRNTHLLSGKRESETKPDQTKETSKEAMRNLVSFPVVHRAIEPSYNGASSLKFNATRGKKLVSPLKDQNKVAKSELKPPSNNTVEEKTLHVIKVEAKSTVPESRDKNQEGTKEIKNELIENKNLTGEALPVLEVDSKKLIPELEHNEYISDPPSFESFSSPSISSPMLSNGEEEAQDEVEYITSEKKVSESKQNGKAFDSPSSDLSLSLNIPSPDKTPALPYGEEASQNELEYTNSEKKIPELKQNESTIDSLPSDSFSSPNIPSPFESPALSYDEEEVQYEFEYTSSREKVPELNNKESTIDSLSSEALPVLEVDSKKLVPELEHNEYISDPPSFESFSSPSISSTVLSNGEEEAQDEVEYITSEKKVSESKQNGKSFDSPSSDSSLSLNITSPDKTSALSYGEEASQDELEYTNSENYFPELKQNESTIDSPPSDSFSSPNIPSPFESPALCYGEEEVQYEFEYTGSRKKVHELNNKESTIDSLSSESFLSPNIPFTVPNFLNGEEESKDKLEDTNSEEKVPECKQNDSHVASIPSTVKSSDLLYDDEEVDDEVVYLDNEINGSDDSISESSETLISDEEKTSVQNHNNKTRKAKIVSEEDDPARKLKFRRGKVVEVECNDTGPKRLKFRRAKILRESQDNTSKSHRKSYEKRGVDDDMDGTKDDSEKVVLRHQQVEGKKDAHGLFNNVIEETATKLAETRKSKVKALVGAFETVISLQESKPSTQTAS